VIEAQGNWGSVLLFLEGGGGCKDSGPLIISPVIKYWEKGRAQTWGGGEQTGVKSIGSSPKGFLGGGKMNISKRGNNSKTVHNFNFSQRGGVIVKKVPVLGRGCERVYQSHFWGGGRNHEIQRNDRTLFGGIPSGLPTAY